MSVRLHKISNALSGHEPPAPCHSDKRRNSLSICDIRGIYGLGHVAPFQPTIAQIEACRWLKEVELAVYADEYDRTGFQGLCRLTASLPI